jgi:PhzF family phenazine biosynthesis protein
VIIPIYQIDAFSNAVFGGNPAAVCPLERWLPDTTLQAIAAENNLAETAFFVKNDSGFHLRWFTPAVEVDLCGHATLASAYVLFEFLGERSNEIHFDTKSGRLGVSRDGNLLTLNFPARPAESVEASPNLIKSLGREPQAVFAARDYLIVYDSEEAVRSLNPDMEGLKQIDRFAVIVTAPGTDYDFVSRFFAPGKGVPEDPVTGSAHCTLIPYWAKRLNKTKLQARQVSKRGGELFCELDGDRVRISGRAALFLKGEILLDGAGLSSHGR